MSNHKTNLRFVRMKIFLSIACLFLLLVLVSTALGGCGGTSSDSESVRRIRGDDPVSNTTTPSDSANGGTDNRRPGGGSGGGGNNGGGNGGDSDNDGTFTLLGDGATRGFVLVSQTANYRLIVTAMDSVPVVYSDSTNGSYSLETSLRFDD